VTGGGGKLGWRAWAGGLVLRALVFALSITWRLDVTGGEHPEHLRAEGRPAVFAFWHDRIFFLGPFIRWQLVVQRGMEVTVLISRSRDGDFGDSLTRLLGGNVIRGSTSRGGSSALRSLIKELRRGRSALIVVDGPKGPRHEAKPGAIMLARAAGVPVVPVTWQADRVWRLGTWDSLEIPKPFSRVEAHFGEPMELPRNLGEEEMEQARQRLGDALGDY